MRMRYATGDRDTAGTTQVGVQEAMKRLDDLPETVTRAESATGLTLSAAVRDLETCMEILDHISFDTDTQRAMLDKVSDLASQAGSIRCDMECHLRATAHEWLEPFTPPECAKDHKCVPSPTTCEACRSDREHTDD
jgi:hypothetical protein